MKPEDRPIMRQIAAVNQWEAICAEPLAMLPEYAATIDRWMVQGGPVQDPQARAANRPQTGGGIGVVPIQGVLTKQTGGLFAALFGGSSTDEIADQVTTFADMSEVGAIVLDIHSPGGSAFGVSIAYDAIMAARERKRVVAVVNSMAGSGAYWLASAADEIVMDPTGLAGGIGVFIRHDVIQEEGVTTTVVSAGRLKAEGVAAPPSDEAIEKMQAMVDDLYGRFVSAVAKGRGVPRATVIKDFGEGLAMGATEAVKVGLVDRLGSITDVLKKLGGDTQAARRKVRGLRAMVRAEGAALGDGGG